MELKKKILAHLREHKTISPSEALDLYRCLDLPGIMLELKRDGQKIRVRSLPNTESGTPHVMYTLED